MDPTALFGTIHESYFTISANFYLYLQYFQQIVFSFSKISEFQTDPKYWIFLLEVEKLARSGARGRVVLLFSL